MNTNNMSLEHELKKHFDEDKVNFGAINDTLNNQNLALSKLLAHAEDNKEFMKNLQWLSDISKATELLKKPSLWFLAFVLGVVALMGGLKAFFIAILSTVGVKNL